MELTATHTAQVGDTIRFNEAGDIYTGIVRDVSILRNTMIDGPLYSVEMADDVWTDVHAMDTIEVAR